MRRWLTRTFTGRALLAGASLKLVAFLAGAIAGRATAFDVIDTIGDITLVVGAVVIGHRLFVDIKQVVLWRVRRKLTLSYIFIGFVPALLIIAFFLVCGLLLFFNVGSYMMRSRITALLDQTRFFGETTAVELQQARTPAEIVETLNRRQRAAASRYELSSFALVPTDKICAARRSGPVERASVTAGPWSHLPAPSSIPAWVTCSGYTGLTTYLDGEATRIAARAVVWPAGGGSAIVVDVPVTMAFARDLQEETGIELEGFSRFNFQEDEESEKLPPEAKPRLSAGPVNVRFGSDAPRGFLGRLEWMSLLDYTDWDTGQTQTLTIVFRMGLRAAYERISEASVARLGNFSFGQILLFLLAVIGALFLIIEAIAFTMGLALARSITGSVHELFVGTERVRRGDFMHKIAIRSRDQLGELAASFNSMTASIEDLLQQKAEKERMEQELRIARNIQMSLLPSGPILLPGVTVVAHCEPAREVGGDYYDFLPIDDHTFGVLVADVSGKGTSAALYMAALKGIVLGLSQLHTSPKQLLIDANRILSRHLDTRSFITVTYILVDLRSRTLRYARAGHCPMIYSPGPHASSRAPQILTPDGLVLGLQLDDGQLFTKLLDEMVLPLREGDLFVLYTDGISETMNPDGDFFGDSRLADLVGESADLPFDDLRERILHEVRTFAGAAAQHDDMTMVLVKVM